MDLWRKNAFESKKLRSNEYDYVKIEWKTWNLNNFFVFMYFNIMMKTKSNSMRNVVFEIILTLELKHFILKIFIFTLK
jgi:hypothetical protein